MIIIEPSIPIDLCELAIKETVEDIKENGFDMDDVFMLISKAEDVKELVGKRIGFKMSVERSVGLPKDAWAIFDKKERFIYYSEGT